MISIIKSFDPDLNIRLLYSILRVCSCPSAGKAPMLADEFALAVSNAYRSAGANAGMLIVNMNTKPDSVLQVFNAGDKERLLFFTIRKWESRATPLFSSIRYEVIYNLELHVFNKQGELLASATTQDIVVKEQGAATSMKQMQAMADEVFKEEVKKLLGKEAIKKFL